MSFRRSVLLEAGLVDEHYSTLAWSEEEDLAFAVRRLGWRIEFEPSAWLVHRQMPTGGMRTESRVPADRSEFYRDRIYFTLKNVGGLDFLRLLWDMYRFTLPPRAHGKAILRRHLAWLRGTWSGIDLFRMSGGRKRPLPYRYKQTP